MPKKEQKKNVSNYMKYYISELEKCGYIPKSIPETWRNYEKDKSRYIIMEAYDKGIAGSTKVVCLEDEAKLPLTKKHFEEDLIKQRKFLGVKISKMPEKDRTDLQDKIAVMNEILGLQDVSAYTKKIAKIRNLETRHKAAPKTKKSAKETAFDAK